jgi:hypothetical protein
MDYLYHEEQIDERSPACYVLKYRGVNYWSCYGVTLETWLENLLKITWEDRA